MREPMSKVYIPQLPSNKGRPQDVSDASRYGLFIAICVWHLANYENLRLLRFDRVDASYYPVTISHHQPAIEE